MGGMNREAAVTSDMRVTACCGGYKVAVRGKVFSGLVWCQKPSSVLLRKCGTRAKFFAATAAALQ